MSADRLALQAQAILEKRIAEDALTLPTSGPMASKLATLLRDATFSTKDAATLIERDAIMAARVMRAANAGKKRASTRVKNLPEALNALGADRLKEVLSEACTNRLFESRDPRIVDAAESLCEHALAVAVAAREVAAACALPEVEAAYLAGLLHDLGKPVVAWLLLEAEKSVVGSSGWIEPEVWADVVARVHQPIGVALASRWGLPEHVSRALQLGSSYDETAGRSMTNCICFADALSTQHGLAAGPFDASQIDGLVNDGMALLGLESGAVARLTSGLKDRVRMMSNSPG
jgi:putative nucleotidyltransferase with HDIG domain